MTSNSPTPSQEAVKSAEPKLLEVQQLLGKMAPELSGAQCWRYHSAVSPGIQEYLEALSLTHYLDKGALITYEEAQQSLTDHGGVPYMLLNTEDYLLGLSDLTGELMRLAISGIAKRGGQAQALKLCAFVRQFKSGQRTM